jgi:glycosyltransferase involved in cell wall biosynthesis
MARPRLIKRVVLLRRSVDTKRLRRQLPATRRLLNAVKSIISDPAPSGPIWAVTMVRNEADIIEETLRMLHAQGVDRFVVADNGSTDETAQILERLKDELPLHVLKDPIVPYWQSDKMSMLARLATCMGAAWIVPFDADEQWYGHDGSTLGAVLRESDAVVVKAKWFLYLPIEENSADRFADRFPYRQRDPSGAVKVAFRANWLARLHMGNHGVTRPDGVVAESLRIAHYTFRSPQQVLRRSREGAAAARATGQEVHVDRWFELEHADEADVRRVFQHLVDKSALVFDPASSWAPGAPPGTDTP